MADTAAKLANCFQAASIDAVAIYEQLFAKCAVGETVPYDSIRAILGFDPQSNHGRSRIAAARRMARRESGYIFETIPNVGLFRLAEREKAAYGAKYIRRAHNAARSGVVALATVDPSKLDDSEKTRFNTVTSQLGAIAECTSVKATSKIAAAIEKSQCKLALSQTLAVFAGKENGESPK